MKTIELHEIYEWAILLFLDSVEEMGYDPSSGVDIREWFTNLTPEEMAEKLDSILDKTEESLQSGLEE